MFASVSAVNNRGAMSLLPPFDSSDPVQPLAPHCSNDGLGVIMKEDVLLIAGESISATFHRGLHPNDWNHSEAFGSLNTSG